MTKSRVFFGGMLAVLVAASVWFWTGRSEAATFKAQATLRDASDNPIGKAIFTGWGDHTDVRVRLWTVPAPADADNFHGFHIHANNDPANGDGCQADASQPAAMWFVSADGHWNPDGQHHPKHLGDMPSLLVNSDGTASARFRTDRFAPGELAGKALILHAGPDNFGNIPLGEGPQLYTANGTEAITLTQNTGNAGNRIACGLISLGG
jgi:Cu-Zn family superoxide dismutase